MKTYNVLKNTHTHTHKKKKPTKRTCSSWKEKWVIIKIGEHAGIEEALYTNQAWQWYKLFKRKKKNHATIDNIIKKPIAL